MTLKTMQGLMESLEASGQTIGKFAVSALLHTIKARYEALQHHAHAHHTAYHRAHNGLHMAYLGLVTAHGPYHIAAGLLLALLLIGYAMHMELE